MLKLIKGGKGGTENDKTEHSFARKMSAAWSMGVSAGMSEKNILDWLSVEIMNRLEKETGIQFPCPISCSCEKMSITIPPCGAIRRMCVEIPVRLSVESGFPTVVVGPGTCCASTEGPDDDRGNEACIAIVMKMILDACASDGIKSGRKSDRRTRRA